MLSGLNDVSVPCLRASKHLFAWLYSAVVVSIVRALSLIRPFLLFSFGCRGFSTMSQTKTQRSRHHSIKSLERKGGGLRLDRYRIDREQHEHTAQVGYTRAQIPIHSSDMEANLILHLNPWRATLSTALATSGSSVSRA